MSLEVYYQQDIRNALLAAEYAMRAAYTKDDRFAQGYHSALMTMALAFGLVQLDDKNKKGSSRLMID